MIPPDLVNISKSALAEIELTRLNAAANLRKEMRALLDQWIEEIADARVARWLLEHREQLRPIKNESRIQDPFDLANPAA